jgi:XRE family transcriptional regulator, fatty acid utilization regulator
MTTEKDLEAIRLQFGSALRELRLDRGMSIERLSRKSRLSRVTISKIENGHTLGGIDAWMKLAKALKISYVELRAKMKTN